MKHAAVRVTVRNGVARLSGTVPSLQHRLVAATAARRVAGVRSVLVDTRVTAVTERSQAPAAQ
jgi:osmotically-inducible protein OsmY